MLMIIYFCGVIEMYIENYHIVFESVQEAFEYWKQETQTDEVPV